MYTYDSVSYVKIGEDNNKRLTDAKTKTAYRNMLSKGSLERKRA